jgi:hypothetical protein
MTQNENESFESFLFSTTARTPSSMHVTLAWLRSVPRDRRQDVAALLKDTADVPGEAIVVLTKDSASLLTDDEGRLLRFA